MRSSFSRNGWKQTLNVFSQQERLNPNLYLLRSETKTKQSTLSIQTPHRKRETSKTRDVILEDISPWRHERSTADFGSLRMWSGRARIEQTLNVDLNSSDALTVLRMLDRAFISTIIILYQFFEFWDIVKNPIGLCQ